MLAKTTAQLLAKMEANAAPERWTRERRGVYHLAGGGYVSRFDMARRILELLPADYPVQARSVLPALTADFNDAAKRPAFSALNTNKFARAFDINLPAWDASLQAAFADHFSPVPVIS